MCASPPGGHDSAHPPGSGGLTPAGALRPAQGLKARASPLEAAGPGAVPARDAVPVLDPVPVQERADALPLTRLRLGATELTTSRLGLGTHGLHWLLSPRERQQLLALAFDLGIRYFDTAPSYGNGLAEAAVGRFAAPQRSQLILATKVGFPVSRLPSRVPGLLYAAKAAGAVGRKLIRAQPARDFSAAGTRRSVEQSLRALRTPYIDILYLHEPTAALLQDADALLATLEALQASGQVRHIGLSGAAAACAEVARLHPALAQALQIEVRPGEDGLPEGAQAGAAAVRFWEFPPARSPPPLARVMERLCHAAPEGVILLSTRSSAVLREAADLCRRL